MMTIPKLTNSNYNEFQTGFTTMADRLIGAFDIPLCYMIFQTGPIGNYNGIYTTCEEKMKRCIELTGPLFESDSTLLYGLYVQHIGTTGIGSTTVNGHRLTCNGRQTFLNLNTHFRNQTYLDNKATNAENALKNAIYQGRHRNFTMETYYTIMTNAFNDLAQADAAYVLNDEQKITKFENGLKEDKAIQFSINTKSEWNLLPAHERTFDRFYNLFSAKMSKY